MASTPKTKDKVESPKAHFVKPKQVVKDTILSHDEKRTLCVLNIRFGMDAENRRGKFAT